MSKRLIYAEDAIKALCKAGCESGYCGISCDDVKAIEQLPSAQPQPLIDQLRWERDVAVKQLHDLGYEFGEEPSAQPNLHTACTQLAQPKAHDKHTETHEKRTKTHSCDCISRQDAIDALGEKPLVWDDLSDFDLGKAAQWSDDVDTIKGLPSAQPETHEERTETHACDSISRQAALEAMDTWDKFGCDPDGKLVRYDDDKHYVPYVHYDDMVHAIKALPSEQPQRMKGRWIYGEHDIAMCDGYWCDKCGFFVPWDYKYTFIDFINDYHFCPNCGSDMKGEKDETN